MVDNDSPSVIQCVLFGALGLLALLPLFALLCKSNMLREFMAEMGWTWCLAACDRCFRTPPDDTADRLERGAEPDRSIATYYRLMYMHHRPEPCLALRLANWREDQRRHSTSQAAIVTKLQQIQVKSDALQRSEQSGAVGVRVSSDAATALP